MVPEAVGKYRIVHRIGRGGMGLVFKAHDPSLDRLVAIKLVSADLEISDEVRARFFREAFACAQLSHPNIVTIYDMGEDDGRLYIVMEYLEGVELSHLIRRRDALTVEAMVSIMVQVCDGLHYAHGKGIVHRDVKPGNILLLPSGDVKIVDFGIARIAATGGLTKSGVLMGTLRYMAPEQMWGRADERSDIFSIGSVFYELLAGRPPFDGDNPMAIMEQIRAAEPVPLAEIDPAIPPEIVAIVEQAMRRDPADRFDDLEQMRTSLEEVQRSLARPEPTAALGLQDAAVTTGPPLDATTTVPWDRDADVVVPARRRTTLARDLELGAVALGLAWLMVWGLPEALRTSGWGTRGSPAPARVADFAGKMPVRPDAGAAGTGTPAAGDAGRGRNDEYASGEIDAVPNTPAVASPAAPPTRREREKTGASRASTAAARRATDRVAPSAATSSAPPTGQAGSARAATEPGHAHPTAPRVEAPRVDAGHDTKQAESDPTGAGRSPAEATARRPAPAPSRRTTEPPDAALPSRPIESSQAPASRAAGSRHGRPRGPASSTRRARTRRHGGWSA